MKRITMVLALLVLVLAACGDNTRVGEGLTKEARDNGNGGPTTRLGERPTTTEPPTTAPTTTAKGATTTTQKPTTTAPRPPSIVIKIQDDGKGSAFQPSVAQVRKGSVVRWTNTDEKTARSVVFDDESVNSGPIKPGGSFDYTANRSGTINYHDGTRPYAVASLQVV